MIYNLLKRMLRVAPLAAAGMLILASCQSEPEYQGIGLKRWIGQLRSEEKAMRIEAAQALGAIGPKAHSAEEQLRAVASADPLPAVRVEAIYALKKIGAATAEFEPYLKEVTRPAVDTEDDEESSFGSDDLDLAEGDGDDLRNGRNEGAPDDDFAYLQALSEAEDSIMRSASASEMPQDPQAQEEWKKARRQEAITGLLQEMDNPDVLAGILDNGDPLQRRLAARMLQNKEGGINSEVFAALTKARADSDTVLKRIAADALKKWAQP